MFSLYDATLEVLAPLIAFDTTSHRSNLTLIAWIERFLTARGVPSWRVPSVDGAKANLFARIGPPTSGGVMLAGHVDVVPVEGQAWTSDPWMLTARNERFYGRGVADMKTFVAMALACIDHPAIASLAHPLVLAFTYDEEVGCLGAPHLLEALPRVLPAPDMVIVGEPTSLKVVSAHKGMRTFRVDVVGAEAHSSQRGQGVSAIAEAVSLMALIADLDVRAAAAPAEPHDICDPPGATLTVGTVAGGTALNIIAGRCTFGWDLRTSDEAVAEACEAEFRAAAADADAAIKARAPQGGVSVTRLSASPPLAQRRHSAAEMLVRELTGDQTSSGVAFVAEAGLYQQAGWPTVLCGPGSIRQAHQPDEWISASQIQEAAALFERLLARLSRKV